MLEKLSQRLQDIFKNIKDKGKITEKDIKESLKEIKLALLEADVHYKIVKNFIAKIEERANQEELSKALTPGQQMIKITHTALTEILGETQKTVQTDIHIPTIILLIGLQGSGKTTTAAKLALQIKKKGHFPLLIAGDKIRPAAIEQLQIMGNKAGVTVFSRGNSEKVLQTIKAGQQFAKENHHDVIIIDTAGRLHIDTKLLEELKEIKNTVTVHETLLILDSLMGQDALRVADTFRQEIGVDGYILTKLDGDARGGVALSIKSMTDIPVKFVGTGEKIDDLEPFHPDRMSSRILGMGDTLTLIEKIEANYDRNELRDMNKKEFRQQFNLNDFYEQLKKIKNMGSLEKIFDLMPMQNFANKNINFNLGDKDKELRKVEAMICSMTKNERNEPDMINGSRRRRIAQGSGTRVSEVNRLLKQFFKMKKFLKQSSNKYALTSFMK